MSIEELRSPIPEVNPEDQPDILANVLLRSLVADLTPRETTPGMDLWAELRYRATGEINYPRWSKSFLIEGNEHVVALYGVHGQRPNGDDYAHNALQCSCSLPDHKSFIDLDSEYQQCPAKNAVIANRADAYKAIVGQEAIGSISDETLQKAAIFLLEIINKDPFAWPPSNRSDRILVDPMASVFDIPRERMRASAEEMAHDQVVHLHGTIHPSISLAA